MAGKDSDFLKRLLATFRVEAQQHIDTLFSGIAELEQMPDETRQADIIEVIFREAHSLKGAARSVNLAQIERVCQTLESTFLLMKRKEVNLTPDLFSKLHQSVRSLSELLDLSAQPEQTVSSNKVDTEVFNEQPEAPIHATAPALPVATTVPGTVKMSAVKLDSIFMQVEEMLAIKLLAQQHKHELQAVNALTSAWAKEWGSIRTRHPDFYKALVNEPQWLELVERNAAFIKNLMYQFGAMGKAVDQDQRTLGRMVDELLEDMKKVLMLPFSTLLEIFPRLVHDLAVDFDKDIELVIQGGEIEADRRILEEIKDPLIHLVRNSVDHGIEMPAERTGRDKLSRGKIMITILPRSGNQVEINISDDGAGIDIGKVKASAERLGIVTKEDIPELDDREAVEFIYQSGLSTSPIITEVSGRGLGLAIVREKVDKLGGVVSVETHPGISTTFRIVLPLTLATYRGISVRVGEQQFVLPTKNVEQTVRVHQQEIQTVENLETIRMHGETLSLVWLGDVLGIPCHNGNDALFMQAMILSAGGKRIAFVVDEVLNEQEVLVKSLGKQLPRVRNIAAATVLGSGKAVPILNVNDLLKSALKVASTRKSAASENIIKNQIVLEQSVLVVEDSITARSLLKGILEIAGYKVTTAVDGIDGITQLRSGVFDIVISDVEMPRMNGFDLTTKIRSDKKFADLPIVLVTALESREDRERGIDVGANAYIVKRNFEQSNLLEVIRQLI